MERRNSGTIVTRSGANETTEETVATTDTTDTTDTIGTTGTTVETPEEKVATANDGGEAIEK